MKTWISLALTLLMLLTLSPAMATADEPAAPPEEEYAGPARLALNPESAYGFGYIPQAYKSNDGWYVSIPLDLRWEGSGFSTEKFKNIVVTVQPMLGSDSPLVPVTEVHEVMLDSTLGLNPQYFNSLGTSFDWMRLTDDCMDGNYSVDFLCSYELDGAFVEQTFTIEFMVSGKKQPEEPPQPEGPKSMPRLMLTGYTISPEKVYAGGDMTLNLTISNVSKRDARNIKITVDSAGVFLPKGGTNVAFLEELEEGETYDLTFTFTVPKSVTAGPAPVTVSMEYEDREVNSATEVAEISVPVYQPIRLKIDDPMPTYTGMVGESFSVEMKLYNLGQTPLYNVMAEISGENIQSEGSYFGGTLEAGATKTVELSAIALDPGMDMGMEDPYMNKDAYGGADMYMEEEILTDGAVYYDESSVVGLADVEMVPLMAVASDGMYYGDGMMGGGSVVYDVTITLTYEDVTGDSYTEIRTCQVEAMQMAYFEDPYYEEPYLPEEPIEEPRSLTWLWITLGGVGVLGAAALVVALSIRARKRKKEIDNALL